MHARQDAGKVRVLHHALSVRSLWLRIGKWFASRSTHPLGMRSIRAAPPLLSALGRSCGDWRVRLRTRSIARRNARTIVTCPKSRAPSHSSPPACRRRSGPRSGRAFGPTGVVATSSSPTQMPTAEGLETQGGPADYGSQGRGRQPVICLPLYSAVRTGGGIWVGL